MHNHDKTEHAAKGKWKGILRELGLPEVALSGKHTSCPLCGGVDRFRWDNKEGRGTYFCGQCGAGNGFDLAMKYTDKSFGEVASEIDRIVGNVKADAPARPPMTDEQRVRALRSVWADSRPVVKGDLVDKYLSSRGIGEVVYPKALRFSAALKDGEGGVRPCMIALVGVYGEKPCTLHRTYLRPDGLAKAEMGAPRKLMPGEIPDGVCVQLSEWTGGPLGIAEGIETAMAASALYEIPVWSAINANLMAKWFPPADCTEVAVFGDNDPKYGGQAAAYALAHKLAVKGVDVTVHIPSVEGQDWADVLALRARLK